VVFSSGVQAGHGKVVITYPPTLPDGTAPAASPAQAPAANAAGWNAGDVTVTWNWADNAGGAGLDPADCPPSSTSSGEGTLTLSAACKDAAGNQGGASATVKVDKTMPVVAVTGASDGASYTLGNAPAPGCTTTDALSGVATAASLQITGGSANGVGAFTATCGGARDQAGNAASASVTYTVGYRFGGFLAPVHNPDTVNSGKAGRTYPIKFRLANASGGYVSALSAVRSITFQNTACGAFGGEPTAPLAEAAATGGTDLRYDGAADQYVYNWKTPGAAGCYTLLLTLAGGQVLPAYFDLR
jgi:hypothetical protein